MTIGSVVVLLFFVAFWGVLHLQSSRSTSNPAAPPEVANNEQSPAVEPSIPAQGPSGPPPAPQAPVSVEPATPPQHPATGPATQIVSTRPVPHPVISTANPLTDKRIGDAVRRGAHVLMAQYDPATHMVKSEAVYAHGLNALCVYALLQCNDAIADPELAPGSQFMAPVLDALKRELPDRTHETYGRSLRANALALINRAVDRPVIEEDVRSLLSAAHGGAYGYGTSEGPGQAAVTDWDNSNSQYGVLGVWAGTEVGITIPPSYWQAVQTHWSSFQNDDGSFGYAPNNQSARAGTLSMTAAGVASLCIALDNVESRPTAVGVDPRPAALIKALAWIDQGDNVLSTPNVEHFASYTRYGVARAGLASGYKYFGKHDWYTELALPQLESQAKDGSFGDTIDTALTLLFLARGRHPILFNKLSIPGVALDHPRDITNLSHYATRELEHTFNAQVVPISADWTQWTESPVLYLPAATDPNVSDEQCDQLRNFALGGGLLFTHADGNSPKFNAFAAKLGQRLFPDYPYQDLAADHPLYKALFKLDPPPPLSGVSNGARLLMVNSPRDLAKSWDVHDWKKVEAGYRVGLNIFLYAAGDRDFSNRLDTNYVAVPEGKPQLTLNVARLRYAGNWDPEPYAWTRFARRFQWKTDFAVNVQPTDIKDLVASGAVVADLTGTDPHEFSADDVVALRRYVQQGGLLLIDSCGGATGFASSQSGLLAALIPGATSRPVPANHPLVNGNGACTDRLAEVIPRIAGTSISGPGIVEFGRGHIVITPLDLTNALLGTHTLGIKGYHPRYAEPFVRNLLLWAYDGQPEK